MWRANIYGFDVAVVMTLMDHWPHERYYQIMGLDSSGRLPVDRTREA